MRAPGQAWLGKGTATSSHSRQMGSAAEGAPELEMGISRALDLDLNCTSWYWMGHVHRLVLLLGSDWAFQERSGAFTGRGQAEKAAKSASAWAEKDPKLKEGNFVGWVAGLRGRRYCDRECGLVFPSFFLRKGFNVFNLVLYEMNLACIRGNLRCSPRHLGWE